MNSTTSTQQTHGERLETEVNIFIMKPSPLKWSQLHTKSGHLWEVSTVACNLEKKNKTHEQMSDINRQTVNFQRLLQSYSNTTSNTSNDRLLTSNGSNLPKPKFQLATCNPVCKSRCLFQLLFHKKPGKEHLPSWDGNSSDFCDVTAMLELLSANKIEWQKDEIWLVNL